MIRNILYRPLTYCALALILSTTEGYPGIVIVSLAICGAAWLLGRDCVRTANPLDAVEPLVVATVAGMVLGTAYGLIALRILALTQEFDVAAWGGLAYLSAVVIGCSFLLCTALSTASAQLAMRA